MDLNTLTLYKNYKKREDIHGTVLYPAVMVAPIQKDIIKELMKEEKIESIFDPFHGSGTSLYEAMEINANLKLIGCDINPLANLITKVKLQGIDKSILKDIDFLKYLISERKYDESFTFFNIKKWFREDIAISLKILRNSIMKIENIRNRMYFWCMLSDIVRKYSNTRSSTYKLHIKENEKIKRIQNFVIEDYISNVEKNIEKYKKSSNNFRLYKCNILEKIRTFKTDCFDITITSPPYGDNATTVTYGQFSSLTLNWIDKRDLEIEGWEYDNYSAIDSKSLGGKGKESFLGKLEKELLEPYLTKISNDKQKKVIRFFSDYFKVISELCRVTKKRIILTLGNRTVDGIKIDLTDITMKYLENNGFKNIGKIEREIPNKRAPRIISKKDNKIVKSINCEYIIIHEKVIL